MEQNMENVNSSQKPPHLKGKSTSKLLQLGLVALMGVWLVSCVRPEPDRSYLTGTPCSIPCWQGITPGVSDEVAVQAVISSLDSVKQNLVKRRVGLTRVSGAVSYVFQDVSGDHYSINLYDGIVYQIQISTSDLALEDVIDAFGPPDSVYATRRPNQHTIYDYYEVQFFYPDKGVHIIGSECAEDCDASHFSGNDVYVGSDISGSRLSFFAPNSDLYTVLTESLLLDSADADQIVTASVPWAGIERYYPSVPWSSSP
jgi:hypothetical protein